MTRFKFISAYKYQPDVSKDILFGSHVFLSIDVEKEGYVYCNDSEESAPGGNRSTSKKSQAKQRQEFKFLEEKKSDFYFKFVKQTIFE